MSEAVELLKALTPLASVVVAGIAVYLNYRSRTARFQENVWAKQFDACVEITFSAYELLSVAVSYINSDRAISGRIQNGPCLNGETRCELQHVASEKHDALRQCRARWVMVVPRMVADALVNYDEVFSAISALPESESSYRPELVRSQNPDVDLLRAFLKLTEAARKSLSLEALEQERLRVLASVPKESRGAARC